MVVVRGELGLGYAEAEGFGVIADEEDACAGVRRVAWGGGGRGR